MEFAGTPQGTTLYAFLAGHAIESALGPDFSGENTGTKGIDTDPVGCHIQHQGAGEADQSPLRGVVAGAALHVGDTEHGGDIDDIALDIVLDHLPDRSPGDLGSPDQVGDDTEIDVLILILLKFERADGYAGVVY